MINNNIKRGHILASPRITRQKGEGKIVQNYSDGC